MKKIVLCFLTAVVALFSCCPKVALASDAVEFDTSAFQWFYRCDEALSGEYGANYKSEYPYAIVFGSTYRVTSMYDGYYTYCVFSKKPLFYNPDTGDLMTSGFALNSDGVYVWDNDCVIRCRGDYNGAYGTFDATVSEGTFAISQGMEYVATYEIKDLEGNVVFQGAPLVTKLAVIMEQANRQTNPMSQIIFLLPLLTFLVASFLGLRKGLQMLRTILSKG